MNNFESSNEFSPECDKPTYVAPKVARLGSLTELTQAMTGMYNDRVTMSMTSNGF